MSINKLIRLSTFFSITILMTVVAGCSSLSIPGYIRPEHPSKKVVYGNFDEVVNAVKDVLDREGWRIAKETHPSLFERTAAFTEDDQEHLLIFTDVRHSFRLIYSKSTHLNVYVNRISEGFELDVRYGSITDFYFKKVRRYRNDRLVKKILDGIERHLLVSP